MDECESQSWQDRCERYFTSISDTGKDRDQEKHQINDSDNSREKRESGYADDNDKILMDLSQVRKRLSENGFGRRVRKTISALDVHGARFASKTEGTAEFIFWMAVVFIVVVAFGVLLFFMMKEFVDETSKYRIKNIRSHKLDVRNISLTICNLNLIKKSKLTSSELNDLKNFLDGTNISLPGTERETVKEVVNANLKLKAFLVNRVSDTFSDFIENIENDVFVQELMSSADTPLLSRLSNYGKPELLRGAAQVSMAAIEEMGHVANETLLQCLSGNTQCRTKDIQTKTDPVHGNCINVSTHNNPGTIEVILDAQSEEYVHQLSPSVGFTVSLSDSADTVQGQRMIIAPGFHSTITVNKMTAINRLDSSCSVSTSSRKSCEDRCLKQHIVKTCSCSLYGEEPDRELCQMDQTSDYVCVRSLQVLQLEGQLPCQCKERCSEKKIDLQMSMVEWPSKQYMMHFGPAIIPGLKNITSGYVRDNVAKLTVHLTPVMYEEIEEYDSKTIMDLLVRVGGLSALVVGVSVVTVLEMVFLMVQCAVRLVRCVRKRSDNVASPRRLSDSEITSITWAMYRQRRRFEEVNKMKVKDKLANNAGVNVLGGNAQARIFKRHSYATPNSKEANGDLVNKQMTVNDSPTRQNYLRRYDGNNPTYQSRNRESLTKERSKGSDKPNGDINKKYSNNGVDYKVNVIRPPRQMDYIYDNRHAHTGNILHPNGFQYTDKNAVEMHRPENVFLYDGAAAYFNTARVSEPVYL